MKHFMTLATIVEIRHTIDTRDAFYEAEQEFFDTESPTMSPLTMKYYETLLASPYRPELEKHSAHSCSLLRRSKPSPSVMRSFRS